MAQTISEYGESQRRINSLVQKALIHIDESITFHIIWNPFGPTNPKHAFADIKDARDLVDLLNERFKDEPDNFYVMSYNYFPQGRAVAGGPSA